MFKGFLTIKFKDNYNRNSEVSSMVDILNSSNVFTNVNTTRNFLEEKIILFDSCNCGIISATEFVSSLNKILDNLYVFDSILDASIVDGISGISLVVYSDSSDFVRSYCYSVRGSRLKFASEVTATELKTISTSILAGITTTKTKGDVFEEQPKNVCDFFKSIFVGYDLYTLFRRANVTRISALLNLVNEK